MVVKCQIGTTFRALTCVVKLRLFPCLVSLALPILSLCFANCSLFSTALDGSTGKSLASRRSVSSTRQRRVFSWWERAPTILAITPCALAATARWSTTASSTTAANSPSTRRSTSRISCSWLRWELNSNYKDWFVWWLLFFFLDFGVCWKNCFFNSIWIQS